MNKKRKRTHMNPQGKIIDTQTYDWYLECVEQNQPVSGKLIKAKGLEIARNIKYHGFSASNGWLQRWRVRHNVNLKPIVRQDTVENLNSNNHIENDTESHTYLDSFYEETNCSSDNAWNSTHNHDEHGVSRRKKDGAASEDDYFDPIVFTEVSYGNDDNQVGEPDCDDDVILSGDDECRFKVDSYASALNAIEGLKNFAQKDEVASKYLNLLEKHFQKEINSDQKLV